MTACGRRAGTRRRGRGGGFTLVELVAVLVIVAVLAAAVAPSLRATDGVRGAMAAKQLLRDLTFARQRAVATGARSWVVFDTGAETWTMLAEDPDNPGRAGARVLTDPSDGGFYIETLGSGSFIGMSIVSASFDGASEVGFDWLGRPLNATESDLSAQGTVMLSGGHLVTVAAETGYMAYVSP